MGLYVNDFLFFSESDSEESRLKRLINNKVTTDFMGDAEFFLESSFECNIRPNVHLLVHVSQQVFGEHTASHFGLEDCNRVPLMTTYCSGCPIDSIPDLDPDNPDLLKRKSAYQYICGSIKWLDILTCPDVATALSFLAVYQGAPNHGHYKAALYALQSLVGTSSFGLA